MDWIDPAQDTDKWQAIVNAVMNLRVSQKIMKLVPGITLCCEAWYIIILGMKMPMKAIFQRTITSKHTEKYHILVKTWPELPL
jgi:hypothetical protein